MLTAPLQKDPFRYSKALHRLRKDEARWVAKLGESLPNRPDAGQQAEEREKAIIGKWKTPVPTLLLDETAKNQWRLLTACHDLEKAFEVEKQRYPRSFISRLLDLIKVGKSKPIGIANLNLKFKSKSTTEAFSYIKKEEISWLQFILTQPWRLSTKNLSATQTLFAEKVVKLLEDHTRDHFENGVSKEDLLKLVNGVSNPAHMFQWNTDVKLAILTLGQMGHIR